jgi:hypothetical protein
MDEKNFLVSPTICWVFQQRNNDENWSTPGISTFTSIHAEVDLSAMDPENSKSVASGILSGN